MKDYKKSSVTRRNEWFRRMPKRLEGHLQMFMWVCLPVSLRDNERGDLDAQPLGELELRKQEADFTNYFLIENGQPQRYEKKSEWLNHKWKKKFEKDS